MSTKIEDIYDAIVSQIETSLSGHKRISNPYAPEESIFLQMVNGYALAIGPGRDTERYVGCLVTWERVFHIILINKITTTPHNIDSRELIEKGLLVDHDTLRKAFYLNQTLGGTVDVIKSTVSDDDGVSFLDVDRQKFLRLQMNLYVEYQETP